MTDWVSELCRGFRQLPVPGAQTGEATSVSFANREDTVGELGREFNALAAELNATVPNGPSRERVHTLRNRLAGILAALQVLGMGTDLSPEQQTQLQDVVEEARRLDATLRTGWG